MARPDVVATARGLAALVATALLAACGDPPPAARPAAAWASEGRGEADATSGLPSEAWFPLVDGTILQYRTASEGETAGSGILPARVFRGARTVGELRMPSGTRRFEYRADGVATLTRDGVWAMLFKLPVAASTTWRGEHGGQARWEATDLTVEVPAGRYEGCARAREERGGDRPAVFVTTFCPGAGVVVLEAASGAAAERAELLYAGPPLDLGPDGLRRVP